MELRDFFLEQYNTVRWIISDLFLKGLSDDQLRHQPREGLNSIAWYMWHTARWQDFANTLINPGRKQVLGNEWLKRMNISRQDIGTGMSRDECTAFNQAISIEGLRAYWDAVGDAVRDVARSVSPQELDQPVDPTPIRSMLHDGTIANERANWLPGLLEGKTKSWFLSMAIWHTAEHLLGGVVCVRRVCGIPVGL
jgi:DinB superfamily